MIQLSQKSRYERKRTNSHLYLAPHGLLKHFIAHYTLSFAQKGTVFPETLSLIPDASGCLVLSFYPEKMESKIWGATTKITEVENDVNLCPVRLFVEFLPGGLFLLTGLEQKEFANQRLSFFDAGFSYDLFFEDMVRSAKNLDHLVESLDRFFLNRLSLKNTANPFLAAVDKIKNANGECSISEICQNLCYSQRHMNRIFKEWMGIHMKQFSNIVRINMVIQSIQKNPDSFTKIAMEYGFFDQSHFIRDFKSVCGVTPGEYLKNKNIFYHEPLKFLI